MCEVSLPWPPSPYTPSVDEKPPILRRIVLGQSATVDGANSHHYTHPTGTGHLPPTCSLQCYLPSYPSGNDRFCQHQVVASWYCINHHDIIMSSAQPFFFLKLGEPKTTGSQVIADVPPHGLMFTGGTGRSSATYGFGVRRSTCS